MAQCSAAEDVPQMQQFARAFKEAAKDLHTAESYANMVSEDDGKG